MLVVVEINGERLVNPWHFMIILITTGFAVALCIGKHTVMCN